MRADEHCWSASTGRAPLSGRLGDGGCRREGVPLDFEAEEIALKIEDEAETDPP